MRLGCACDRATDDAAALIGGEPVAVISGTSFGRRQSAAPPSYRKLFLMSRGPFRRPGRATSQH